MNLSDLLTHYEGELYYQVKPVRKGSCHGCALDNVMKSCSNVPCDGRHGQPEFILIDRTESALAKYVTQRLTNDGVSLP